MIDPRFKWLTGCISVTIIMMTFAIVYVSIWSNNNKSTSNDIGDYVYLDKTRTLHCDRECSRLNYKGMLHARILLENLRGIEVRVICGKCVNDGQYERLLKTGITIDDNWIH